MLAPQPPAARHVVLSIGLGFVAGFVDIFGFLAWHGLLVAHVTGNLVFLGLSVARGDYDLLMKVLALPIFAVSVAVSARVITALRERGWNAFVPAALAEAVAIALCLVAGLSLAAPQNPDDTTAILIGALGLFAMGLQNTMMRLVLNDMPPTTAMTTNLTSVVSELAMWSARRNGTAVPLTTRARLIGSTLAGFTLGAVAGGLSEVHAGYFALLVPITTLLALLPVGRKAAAPATA
ncbi:MAG: YoaK family protein [Acetobacteraceae bacterium]